MSLRAISLTQPWATLMSISAKNYETRGPTFPRRHLGELAICASLNFPKECQRLCYEEPFHEALRRGLGDTIAALPLGAVVGVVEVVGYVTAVGGLPSYVARFGIEASPAPHEAAFGDYTQGRTVILTRNARRLAEPVPVRGALGVWTLPPDVEERVREQLKGVNP